MIDRPTYCTLLADRECKENDCCMKIPTISELKQKVKKNINNWSISCEKNETINRHQYIADSIANDSF